MRPLTATGLPLPASCTFTCVPPAVSTSMREPPFATSGASCSWNTRSECSVIVGSVCVNAVHNACGTGCPSALKTRMSPRSARVTVWYTASGSVISISGSPDGATMSMPCA
jgi:hypothetical protein